MHDRRLAIFLGRLQALEEDKGKKEETGPKRRADMVPPHACVSKALLAAFSPGENKQLRGTNAPHLSIQEPLPSLLKHAVPRSPW